MLCCGRPSAGKALSGSMRHWGALDVVRGTNERTVVQEMKNDETGTETGMRDDNKQHG